MYIFIFCRNAQRAVSALTPILMDKNWSITSGGKNGMVHGTNEGHIQIAAMKLDGTPKSEEGFMSFIIDVLRQERIEDFGVLIDCDGGSLRWNVGQGRSSITKMSEAPEPPKETAPKKPKKKTKAKKTKEEDPPTWKTTTTYETPEHELASDVREDLIKLLVECKPLSDCHFSASKDRHSELLMALGHHVEDEA